MERKQGEIAEAAIPAPLRAEFPELGMKYATVNVAGARTPRGLKEQLKLMSDRLHGGRALTMRQEPIPYAYRTFFFGIGLDPDRTRTPIEAVVVERLKRGGLISGDHITDALAAAILDTSVALWAYDAEGLSGRLTLRQAVPGERLDPDKDERPAIESGKLIVADEAGPLAILFGAAARRAALERQTKSCTVCALRVAGVPEFAIEEALWECCNHLGRRGP